MWVFTGNRKYVDDGVTHLVPVEPVAGIGPGPLTDDEFAQALDRLEAQHDDTEKGSLVASGIYQHKKDDKTAGGPEWAARLGLVEEPPAGDSAEKGA